MYILFNRYLAPQVIFLFLSEFIIVMSTAIIISAARFDLNGSVLISYDPFLFKTTVMAVIYMLVFYYSDLYSPEFYAPGRQMIVSLLAAVAAASVMLFSIYYLVPSLKAWRGILIANALLLPAVLIAWRRFFMSRFFTFELPEQHVLIIGTGDLAKKIGSEIYNKKANGLKLMGFIDEDPSKLGQSIVNPGVIGCFGDIAQIVKSVGIKRIIVALPDRRAKLPMLALLDCKLRGVIIEEGETFQEHLTGRIPLDQLKPSWMVFSDGFKSLRTRKIVKRVFDAVLSVIGFVIVSPIMLIAAIAIRLESKGPVIFKQIRVGENQQKFEIYKFRSMRTDAESSTGPVWAQANDSRVTNVGRFIRATRIDELPQLVNILKGEMSFVGPRPERPFFVEQLKEKIPYYEMRMVVKPGITGWAQIKYPYGASYSDALEKLQYDIYYIKNMSPMLDIMIILLTVKVVLTGKGAR
ncbi:MAG: TIGR03013 family PEP-CTERM/XrtA system glycosyltransferase [Deltaproteobacteria bacterium]|nr:TIGR03013 family PEP-CTERM/XrtA system glycosyltransferase [Deltaproteobacteria bacterium]